MNKKHVLLIYPSAQKDNPGIDDEFASGWTNLPIGILSVGTYIKQEGYDVTILDFRRYAKKDVLKKIEESIKKETICVGFSMMTMQLGHGLKIIDHIKNRYDLPIVLGGIHGTLFPAQTVLDKNIDYVISGEGEISFFKLLKYIDSKKGNLKEIDGLSYKIKSKVHMNPSSTPLNVEELPFPDYSLMEDLELYIQRKYIRGDGPLFETRMLDIHTSRGCPYQCTYCINTLPYFKKWRSKKLPDILEHIDYVVKKYNLDFIWFADDYFFGDIGRVKSIANHLIKKNYSLRWEATIRANLFNQRQVNDELLPILKKSGCFALGMGFESGSDRILKKIKKGILVEHILTAVSQCKKYGIMPRGSFMCGVPTETQEEVKQTGKLILRLKRICPDGTFYSPGLLRPYPGAELYKECISYGMTEPTTARGWADKNFVGLGFYMQHEELKWVKNPGWLINYQIYLHLASLRLNANLLNKKQSIPYSLFGTISLWRIEHDFLYLPIEPAMLLFARKMVMAAKKIFKIDS